MRTIRELTKKEKLEFIDTTISKLEKGEGPKFYIFLFFLCHYLSDYVNLENVIGVSNTEKRCPFHVVKIIFPEMYKGFHSTKKDKLPTFNKPENLAHRVVWAPKNREIRIRFLKLLKEKI